MRAAPRRLLPAPVRRPTWKPQAERGSTGLRSGAPSSPSRLCVRAGGECQPARSGAPAGQAARAPPLAPRVASSPSQARPTVVVQCPPTLPELRSAPCLVAS
ncbi:hypothetical protein NN561_008617 [Cricetulus griseus]